MEKLSGIASDYLADIDILEQARRQTQAELAVWWRELVESFGKTAESRVGETKVRAWDRKNKPGYLEFYVKVGKEDYPLRLQMEDRTNAGRHDYEVRLAYGSAPELNAAKRDAELVQTLNQKAIDVSIGALDWASTRLAVLEVPLLPDDPEQTKRLFIEAGARVLDVIMAAYWHSAGKL